MKGDAVSLTKAERSLLKIIERGERPGFTPRIDTAHKKHQPALFVMRAKGVIAFSHSDPVMRITPAGRSALESIGGDHG